MRDYGKVFSRIWESVDFRSLTEDGRALVMYLLTCQHGTIAGVFRVPDGYACEDLQWSAERVSEGFRNIEAKGFATRCEVTKWVWVCKYLEWNPPENPNQRKAAVKMAASVPDGCCWKSEFMRVCGPSIGIDQHATEPTKTPQKETLSQPLPNQYQEQEQEQKKEHPPGFARFWSAWPKNDRKEAKGKCLEAWRKAKAEAVADAVVAHVERMKASPAWTKDNGQFVPAPLVYLNQRRWEGAEAGDAPSDLPPLLAGAV